MNVFILILYTFALFSVSQGGIFEWIKETWRNLQKLNFEYWNKHPASRILYEYLDPDEDPCDNFYRFSCGNWIKTIEQKKGKFKSLYYESRMGSFDKFTDEFKEGKYNNESKIINTLYELRKKCKKLSTYKIYDCNLEISNFGKYALSSIFIKRNKIRSEENGDYSIIEDMIKRIKEEFRLIIDEKKDIFDEETINNFKYKFDKMKFVRNFDKLDLTNVTSMENCYDNIGIDYNDKITNILEKIKNLKALSYSEQDSLNSCRGKLFQHYIIMKLFVYGNAVYNHDYNYFAINSDTLNEPSFSKHYPNALNFGYFGYTIAHEILHAFDNQNYNRTLEGDNKNKFRVTEKSIKNFGDRSDCFVKQYGMQKEGITNKNINGSLTLVENIPDNGGIKIAHRAYVKYLSDTGVKNESVPSFEKFTEEQLFFISIGRRYCEYTSKDYLEILIDKDPHPPSEIRTNVALSNYKPFSDAFNCPRNSKMNPEKKCELWRNH